MGLTTATISTEGPPWNSSDLFEVIIEAEVKRQYEQLEGLIDHYSEDYDRFIFLYSEENTNFKKYWFERSLYSGTELQKKAYLAPLVYADMFEERGFPSTSAGVFEFREQNDRLIQIIGLTYAQAAVFFRRIRLTERPTCMVLVNLDRLGYRTTTLLNFYTSLLPYLSPMWGYICLSRSPPSLPFYHWLARRLRKTPPMKIQRVKQETTQSWNLRTIDKIFYTKGEDTYLPPQFGERIRTEARGIAGLDVLFTDVSREIKEHYIRLIRSRTFDRRAWKTWRQLLLVKLINDSTALYQKLLIVTNSFDDESWQDFLSEVMDVEYPEVLTPKFWPVEDVHLLSQELSSMNYDHIILDFGDELSPWLSTPLIRNILEHAAILQIAPLDIEVTFFHPFLLSSSVVEWLLSHPPVPSRLAMIEDPDQRQQELARIAILLTALKRTRKDPFYQEIGSSLFQLDVEDEKLDISDLVRNLRLTGLLEHRHFHTTALGRFFLKHELNIGSFLTKLLPTIPALFTRTLTQQGLNDTLFAQYYQTASKWLFHATKHRRFGVAFLTEFQDALQYTFRVMELSVSLRDAVIDAMTVLIAQEQKKHPKFRRYFQQMSRRLVGVKAWDPKRPQFRKLQVGAAFVKVLEDVQRWKNRLEHRERWMFKDPFFPVRIQARKARHALNGVPESSYVRAVSRIFTTPLTDSRTLAYFARVEEQFPALEGQILNTIKSLRETIALRKMRATPRRDVLALVLLRSRTRKSEAPVSRYEYLNQTCQDCFYFDMDRKRECRFFDPLSRTKKTRVPPSCKIRMGFITGKMVGCPIWRPINSYKVEWPKKESLHCVHCFQPLPKLQSSGDVCVCSCETQYRLLAQEDSPTRLVEYQLTKTHQMHHDIAILLNYPRIHFRLTKKATSQFPPHQVYTPERHGPLEQFVTNLSQYLFLQTSDKLKYDTKEKCLIIGRKHQPSDVIDLTKIRLIDSQKQVNALQLAVRDHPHLLINLRTYNLTVSPRKKGQDRARIVEKEGENPKLKVRWYRKKIPEYYPLHKIISLYNIGKPRLTPTLKSYGIEVINRSVKGIRSKPIPEIIEALELEGVRPFLSEIHLLSLVISALHATTCLVELTEIYHLPALGREIIQRLKKRLYEAPTFLDTYYQEIQNTETSPILPRCRLEAWISRPFADGIRKFVKNVQIPTNPLIHRPYGRKFARLINKQIKRGSDFQGGYTKFDAALNSIHRTLSHRLRIWNAKAGLGFDTTPLFSHQARDNPGISGHLDLEEVGRYLSRLALARAIATRQIHGGYFGTAHDDAAFTYYFPWGWAQHILRGTLVHRHILQYPLWYNHQWLPYAQAHRVHVNHLCTVLLTCHQYSSISDRNRYLLYTYTPLLYFPSLLTRKSQDLWNKLQTIFEYSWIHRTRKRFKKQKLLTQDIDFPLINSELVSRLLH